MTKNNMIKTYTTSDIAIAAYFKLQGLLLVECDRQNNKFRFVFEDPNDYAGKLELDFINSDMRRYDDEMRSLKKIIHNKK
jgi:hypothetical protein